MYSPRVNITLHENPEIITQYESGEISKDEAIFQVLSEIEANNQMDDGSIRDGVITRCAREAFSNQEYRQRGVYERGDDVYVYSWVRDQNDGTYVFDLRHSDEEVGPIPRSKYPVQGDLWDGQSADFPGTIVRREGVEYFVKLGKVGETVGPLPSDGFTTSSF